MTAKDIVTILVPVLVAVVSGLYAYMQTRKTTSVEGRKLDLTGYESLNKSQAAEIERLRADRLEDQTSAREQINDLRRRLAECTVKVQQFDELQDWARQVVRILNDPGVRRILSASGVPIPPLPPSPPPIPPDAAP